MSTWNGRLMAEGRSTSILDMADIMLARCGARSTPVGLCAERVRILMLKQAKYVEEKKVINRIKVNLPNPKALKPIKIRVNKRRDDCLKKWLATPEDERDFHPFAKKHRIKPTTLGSWLHAAKINPYPPALRARVINAYADGGIDHVEKTTKLSRTLVVRILYEAGIKMRKCGAIKDVKTEPQARTKK